MGPQSPIEIIKAPILPATQRIPLMLPKARSAHGIRLGPEALEVWIWLVTETSALMFFLIVVLLVLL